jgi:iron-sulfur cluster assembly protein
MVTSVRYLPDGLVPLKEETEMIHVTGGAIDLLESINDGLPEQAPEHVLRLESLPDQKLGLVLGEAQGDDQVVGREGAQLLHIASPLSDALDGGVIDKVETPDGPRFGFAMEPPNGAVGEAAPN